jgi:hypothetical protein
MTFKNLTDAGGCCESGWRVVHWRARKVGRVAVTGVLDNEECASEHEGAGNNPNFRKRIEYYTAGAQRYGDGKG